MPIHSKQSRQCHGGGEKAVDTALKASPAGHSVLPSLPDEIIQMIILKLMPLNQSGCLVLQLIADFLLLDDQKRLVQHQKCAPIGKAILGFACQTTNHGQHLQILSHVLRLQNEKKFFHVSSNGPMTPLTKNRSARQLQKHRFRMCHLHWMESGINLLSGQDYFEQYGCTHPALHWVRAGFPSHVMDSLPLKKVEIVPTVDGKMTSMTKHEPLFGTLGLNHNSGFLPLATWLLLVNAGLVANISKNREKFLPTPSQNDSGFSSDESDSDDEQDCKSSARCLFL
jgi:hypothetical protein